jgi:surface-anchored protein
MKTISISSVPVIRRRTHLKENPLRKPIRLMLGSGILAAVLLGTAVPAQATDMVVLSAGHVDVVDLAYEDGVLEIGVHDETVEPDVEREVDDVIFLVKNAAKTTVPDNPAFGFLGAPGKPVWILPEIQNEELIWPGIATEEIESGVFAADTVTLQVEKVTGSGRVAIFTENALATAAHQHASWAFQKAGVYLIKVRATAELAATGQSVTSEPAVYKFVVQP